MTQRQAQLQAEDVRGPDPWGLRRVEHLLRSVEGVDSLKIVPDGHGGIDEIHVLSTSDLGAKQIVRNIESALLAQFGLQVDHRKISIAQVRQQDLPAPESPVAATLEPEPARREEPPRLGLEGLHVDRRAGERVLCRVQLTRGEDKFEGESQGPDYPKARLEVAAQAVLNALAKANDGECSYGIEGVSQIDLYGRRLVVALVHASSGRANISLPGIAEITDSVEESVVMACLSATNRWSG